MSYHRHSSHYHKRREPWQRLGRALFALLLLAGFAAAVFLVFLRGYVIDTAEGPRLQLPLFSGGSLLGKDSEEASAPALSAESTVSLPDTPLLSPLHAIRISEEALLEDTALQLLQDAGGNALILDMRDEQGRLHYVSKLPDAIESGASASNPALNERIRTLNLRAEVYSIARVSCFSDDYLTALRPSLALQREGGVPWRDEAMRPHLSPSQPEVQQYLSAICRELAALGFDEILLDGCAFPTKGARAQLFTGGDAVAALAVQLEDFYQTLRREASAEGLYLSLRYSPSETDAAGRPQNGQVLETLLPLADRVWLEEAVNSAEVFAARGLSVSNLSLIPILENPGLKSASWAVF